MFSRIRNAYKHSHEAHRSLFSARRNGYWLRFKALAETMLLVHQKPSSPRRSNWTLAAVALLLFVVPSIASAQSKGKPGGGSSSPAAGISILTAPTFSSPGKMFTTELGGTAEFRVVLDSQPTADVTINLTSEKPLEGKTVAPWLIFTPNNWNTPQTVSVIGENDLDPDGTVSYWIFTAPAISADLKYNGLNAADVLLANIDDETAPENAIYVRGFGMEERLKGPSTEIRLNIDVRHDSNFNRASEDSDTPVAGVVVVISIYDSNGTNVRNFVGTTSAAGTGTTAWYKLPGTGDYHIEVHDVSLDGYYWDPLNELESILGDRDGDGKPDLQLTLT